MQNWIIYEKMNTILEMNNYILENEYYCDTKDSYEKVLENLISFLKREETVETLCSSASIITGNTIPRGSGIVAITNQRIIYSTITRIKANIVNGIELNDFSNIKVINGAGKFSVITITCIGETITFSMNPNKANEFVNKIQQIIDNIKNNSASNNSKSPAEELKTFKELLDMGAITEEEFNAKKKQLLGL